MIITCESCNTSFNLDDKMLKPTGSKVRCSVCTNVFTAFPQQAPTPEPSTETVEPDIPQAEEAGSTPETEVLKEDAGALLADGADLDVGLEADSVDEVLTTGIDGAVSEALNERQTDAADGSDQTALAGLDDNDLDLDLSPEQADQDGAATVLADLDDDELGLSFDEQTDSGETVIADLDGEDFDLDTPPASDDDPDGTATIIADLDDDELDLDSDFSAKPQAEAGLEASTDDIPRGTMEDIDDLDLTLELGDEDAGDVESAPESPVFEDDLDLSSLESLLQDDENVDDDAVTMIVDGGEETELDLNLDDETPAAEAVSTEGADDSLEELEFDLDGDGSADNLGIDDADGVDQEVDLSEIEKMLEDPEPQSDKFSSAPEQDLDLDIEASLETEKWMSESGDDEQLVVDDELDLSELEQVLEDVDTDASDDAVEDPELDLDLGNGESLDNPTETVVADKELDFDLSDFEDVAPPASDGKAAASEPADMELEFEVEEASHEERSIEDEGLEDTVAVAEPTAAKSGAAWSGTPRATAPATTPAPVKKGVSKSLIFLLILVILGGGGYGTYYLLEKNGIDIPFLSDYFKPKVQDSGNLKLTTYDINSRFIDNANVGKLFVISGQVKNGYTNNRGMITLMGSIFSTNKTLVQQEKVYCGNVMSDLELANLEWDQIKARQSNRLGDNRSNVKIEPGSSIPFMVVFSDLPEDLEEFTIEVTGSTSLK